MSRSLLPLLVLVVAAFISIDAQSWNPWGDQQSQNYRHHWPRHHRDRLHPRHHHDRNKHAFQHSNDRHHWPWHHRDRLHTRRHHDRNIMPSNSQMHSSSQGVAAFISTDAQSWNPTDAQSWNPTDAQSWNPTDAQSWNTTGAQSWNPSDAQSWNPWGNQQSHNDRHNWPWHHRDRNNMPSNSQMPHSKARCPIVPHFSWLCPGGERPGDCIPEKYTDYKGCEACRCWKDLSCGTSMNGMYRAHKSTYKVGCNTCRCYNGREECMQDDCPEGGACPSCSMGGRREYCHVSRDGGSPFCTVKIMRAI